MTELTQYIIVHLQVNVKPKTGTCILS